METPVCREILLKVSPFWIFTHAGWVGVVGADFAGAGDGEGGDGGEVGQTKKIARMKALRIDQRVGFTKGVGGQAVFFGNLVKSLTFLNGVGGSCQ